MQEVGVVRDRNIDTSVVTKDHQVGLVLRVQICRFVLNHHVVVVNIDERLVVLEEVLECAVSYRESCVPTRVDTDAAREVVQHEQGCVA